MKKPKYPGHVVTINGNQLVALTEAKISDCGVFYPITPSTEMGEYFEMSVSQGTQTVWGDPVKAIEAEGEHAAQGGAIAFSVTGKRVSNFTSGQGVVYGLEQYFHAPGKLSTMVLNVGARALTKHALNVHCGHDDIMSALNTGWTMLMAKDAQQAVDQSIISRKVAELTLNPVMNIQDGFLTTHLERTFRVPESGLLRDYLGRPGDTIDCPTKGQIELFGKTRRRVPEMYSLHTPILLGSVQNQEHYMTGVIARRTAFVEDILTILERCYAEFAELTGRKYGLLSSYNCEKADTVFLSIGCSAENIEAAIDYIKVKHKDEIGVIHLNCIRPFPEKAIIEALRGKKNVIILERTDEPHSGSNPLARDVRTALSKALEKSYSNLPHLKEEEIPRIFEGVYGLGSRDFRPEHIFGAYEYVRGKIARQDGKLAKDGFSFFYLGVNHEYAVVSKDQPSLLPESAIAIRIHSIGGWGAITTGKNMAEILGTLAKVSKHKKSEDDQVIHISANPKYGSEKKGAPTNYFLVVADERIRVNCDLHHVDVVLCCDPKIFTHTNPLFGLKPGGAFIWESNQDEKEVWERIPVKYRKQIIEDKIKVYTLNGFEIAKAATSNESLQTRMQGNSFLGAFFKVSPFLKHHGITPEHYQETVKKQYEKKFGKFGPEVVASNMMVMEKGYSNTKEIKFGDLNAADHSPLIGHILKPINFDEKSPNSESGSCPVFSYEEYKQQFLTGDVYNQKATALTSTGIMPSGTGVQISKFVSRIKVPVYDPYSCTQCMACIDVCPDTALPNTAQSVDTILQKIFSGYISDESDRSTLVGMVSKMSSTVRDGMNQALQQNTVAAFDTLLFKELQNTGVKEKTLTEIKTIVKDLPLGYGKAKTIFQMAEKKNKGDGGLFSIFVSDLCKGCGECVDACGDHMALKMVEEDVELRGKHLTASSFLKTLPSTPKKYLGLFNPDNIEESRTAVLHNHLMIQENYNSFTAGDGACAGCGEKSVLRGIVTMTEALMRPLWDHKVERISGLAKAMEQNGLAALSKIKEKSQESYESIRISILHLIMGYGGDDLSGTQKRIEKEFKGNDKDLIDALIEVLKTDAKNHERPTILQGELQGMTVMGMAASTGCNTVYGSTHPSNPHKYPWMNSLFQDGATIGWLVAESFMDNHARRSIIPERISNMILAGETEFSSDAYLKLAHFDDSNMTDKEILELPKVWCVGGDGAFGDIGFQNVSKVVLQNRPNVKILMLDTQVYSNTGGQNSDSSIMPGGFDMNQYGKYHEGKLTERKELAQIFTSGHGSPYVACVSMANTAKFFKALLDGLLYRGTAFFQSFTSCQPEHGIPDNMSQTQALRIRDSRGVPEFTYNSALGESDSDAFDIKSNPRSDRDWQVKKDADKNEYNFDVTQWAFTEGRFRKHFFKLKEGEEKISLHEILLRVNQNDVTHRKYLDKAHRGYIPLKGVYVDIVDENGKKKRMGISRHLVLFAIERRKNWRKLQSKSGIKNKDYEAQKVLIQKLDAGEIKLEDAQNFYNETLKGLLA